jgi:hypothetical protein
MGMNLAASEAIAVFALNRDAMVKIIMEAGNMEDAVKALTLELWEAQTLRWVYDRAGYFKGEVELDGIQESGKYRLTESQAMLILHRPLNMLLEAERDNLVRRWNNLFLAVNCVNKTPKASDASS